MASTMEKWDAYDGHLNKLDGLTLIRDEELPGGSALQGEDPLSCAIRELQEETGIVADELTEVGRILHYGHQTYYVDYLCITDVEKESIILQEGETSAYKWVTCDELRRMSRDEIATQRIQNFIEELR